jgi:CHASE3 domain sensor protein
MSAQKQSKSTSLLKIAWTVVPLVLIACSAYLTFRSQTALSDSVAALDRGFDLRTRIRQVYVSLVEAETGQRGFLLTSKNAYIVPYDQAVERLPEQFDQLASMLSDQPDQQEALQKLRALMNDKLTELGQTIRYARAGDMPAALKLVNSDLGQVDMNNMRVLIGQMLIDSDRALATRQKVFFVKSEANTRLAFLLVLANGTFFAIAAAALWRIRKMESLVTVCAWSGTIEYEGEWMSFEEYLRRRFDLQTTHGISPAEAARFKKAVESTAVPRA